MLNLHRYIYRIVIFTLLVSVGVAANAKNSDLDNNSLVPTPYFAAFDNQEPSPVDFDLDSHVNTLSNFATQPRNHQLLNFYTSCHFNVAFSHALQRGPPTPFN